MDRKVKYLGFYLTVQQRGKTTGAKASPKIRQPMTMHSCEIEPITMNLGDQ